MTDQDARRRQAVALILSGVFPGLGQFYNRRPVKAIAFLVAGAILSWLLGRVAPTDLRALLPPRPALLVLLGALLVLSLWSVIDAWRDAGRAR